MWLAHCGPSAATEGPPWRKRNQHPLWGLSTPQPWQLHLPVFHTIPLQSPQLACNHLTTHFHCHSNSLHVTTKTHIPPLHILVRLLLHDSAEWIAQGRGPLNGTNSIEDEDLFSPNVFPNRNYSRSERLHYLLDARWQPVIMYAW